MQKLRFIEVFTDPKYSRFTIILILTTLIGIYFYGEIDYLDSDYRLWDLQDYKIMAENSPNLKENVTLDKLRQPFVFRITGPFLSGLLPFEIITNFKILNILFSLTLSLLTFYYLLKLNVEIKIALILTIFYVFNKYLFGFPVWNYFHLNDILVQIIITLLFLIIYEDNFHPIKYAFVLVIGAFTKETAMIMIPVGLYYFWEFNKSNKHESNNKNNSKVILDYILYSIPAIFTFVLIRIYLNSQTGNNLYEAILEYSEKLIEAETWFRLMINSIIPFSLLPVIYYSLTKEFFRGKNYLILYTILVILSTFFGINNERLMAPVSLVLLPLLGYIFQNTKLKQMRYLLPMILFFSLSIFHHTYSRFPLNRKLTIILSIFSLILISLLVIYEKYAYLLKINLLKSEIWKQK